MVSSVEGHHVKVTILSQSACQSCHAKGTCSMGGEENKEIELDHITENYQVGEKVNVIMRESTGMTAMLLGYFIPFIVMIIILIALQNLFHQEGLSALGALGSVALYYLILYFLKGKLSRKLTFTIEKI